MSDAPEQPPNLASRPHLLEKHEEDLLWMETNPMISVGAELDDTSSAYISHKAYTVFKLDNVPPRTTLCRNATA